MRKLTYLVVVIMSSLLLSYCKTARYEGETVRWYDWNSGYEFAQKEHRMVFVNLTQDWCSWCLKMDKETFGDDEVALALNEHFVPIKVNADIKFHYKLGLQMLTGDQLVTVLTNKQHLGYPTLVFMYPPMKIIRIHTGYLNTRDFTDLMNKFAFYVQDNKKDMSDTAK